MKEKFIIEITDVDSKKWYFGGFLHNQIQFTYSEDKAFRVSLSPCIINYEMCKRMSYKQRLKLNFEIKEL